MTNAEIFWIVLTYTVGITFGNVCLYLSLFSAHRGYYQNKGWCVIGCILGCIADGLTIIYLVISFNNFLNSL